MESIFNISIDQIVNFLKKILDCFKQLMAWLGILVFPEEGEYDYPTAGETDGPTVEP